MFFYCRMNRLKVFRIKFTTFQYSFLTSKTPHSVLFFPLFWNKIHILTILVYKTQGKVKNQPKFRIKNLSRRGRKGKSHERKKIGCINLMKRALKEKAKNIRKTRTGTSSPTPLIKFFLFSTKKKNQSLNSNASSVYIIYKMFAPQRNTIHIRNSSGLDLITT